MQKMEPLSSSSYASMVTRETPTPQPIPRTELTYAQLRLALAKPVPDRRIRMDAAVMEECVRIFAEHHAYWRQFGLFDRCDVARFLARIRRCHVVRGNGHRAEARAAHEDADAAGAHEDADADPAVQA